MTKRGNGRVELNAETLCGISLFRQLTAQERKVLVSRCRAHHYRATQLIFSHHDTSRDVFFVISGTLRATLYSLAGKQVTFKDIGAGQMFGELSAIDGAPRSAHVVAISDALVVSMSPQDFWETLRTYPPVAEATLKRLTGLVRFLSERIFEVCTLPVKDRIHVELLHLAQEHMRDDNTACITPAPTHADIASRIGTHREAVTRVLNDLKGNGLLTRRRGALVVSDVNQLTRIVNNALGI
jgi:CRP-like cAMP-binding protein